MRKHGDGTRRATDRARRIGFRPRVDGLERRVLLTSQTFPPPTSSRRPRTRRWRRLRMSRTRSRCARPSRRPMPDPGPVTIDFDLVPKNIPGVVNFDLTNQVWTFDVNITPLPPITGQVTIDGYTQKYVTPVRQPKRLSKSPDHRVSDGGNLHSDVRGRYNRSDPFQCDGRPGSSGPGSAAEHRTGKC